MSATTIGRVDSGRLAGIYSMTRPKGRDSEDELITGLVVDVSERLAFVNWKSGELYQTAKRFAVGQKVPIVGAWILKFIGSKNPTHAEARSPEIPLSRRLETFWALQKELKNAKRTKSAKKYMLRCLRVVARIFDTVYPDRSGDLGKFGLYNVIDTLTRVSRRSSNSIMVDLMGVEDLPRGLVDSDSEFLEIETNARVRFVPTAGMGSHHLPPVLRLMDMESSALRYQLSHMKALRRTEESESDLEKLKVKRDRSRLLYEESTGILKAYRDLNFLKSDGAGTEARLEWAREVLKSHGITAAKSDAKERGMLLRAILKEKDFKRISKLTDESESALMTLKNRLAGMEMSYEQYKSRSLNVYHYLGWQSAKFDIKRFRGHRVRPTGDIGLESMKIFDAEPNGKQYDVGVLRALLSALQPTDTLVQLVHVAVRSIYSYWKRNGFVESKYIRTIRGLIDGFARGNIINITKALENVYDDPLSEVFEVAKDLVGVLLTGRVVSLLSHYKIDPTPEGVFRLDNHKFHELVGSDLVENPRDITGRGIELALLDYINDPKFDIQKIRQLYYLLLHKASESEGMGKTSPLYNIFYYHEEWLIEEPGNSVTDMRGLRAFSALTRERHPVIPGVYSTARVRGFDEMIRFLVVLWSDDAVLSYNLAIREILPTVRHHLDLTSQFGVGSSLDQPVVDVQNGYQVEKTIELLQDWKEFIDLQSLSTSEVESFNIPILAAGGGGLSVRTPVSTASPYLIGLAITKWRWLFGGDAEILDDLYGEYRNARRNAAEMENELLSYMEPFVQRQAQPESKFSAPTKRGAGVIGVDLAGAMAKFFGIAEGLDKRCSGYSDKLSRLF